MGKPKINGYYESQRRAKRAYKKRHREKVNAARRAARLRKRQATMGDRKCASCEMFLKYSGKASIRFCTNCRENSPKDVRALEPLNVKRGLRKRPWMKNVPIKSPIKIYASSPKPMQLEGDKPPSRRR